MCFKQLPEPVKLPNGLFWPRGTTMEAPNSAEMVVVKPFAKPFIDSSGRSPREGFSKWGLEFRVLVFWFRV